MMRSALRAADGSTAALADVRALMRGSTILPAVVAILVLVALAILGIRYARQQEGTNRKTRADIRALGAACDRYAAEHGGRFPARMDELLELDAEGGAPYFHESRTLDSWGRPYRFEAADSEFPYPRIWTFGRDGLPGGEGDDRDVGTWMSLR